MVIINVCQQQLVLLQFQFNSLSWKLLSGVLSMSSILHVLVH